MITSQPADIPLLSYLIVNSDSFGPFWSIKLYLFCLVKKRLGPRLMTFHAFITKCLNKIQKNDGDAMNVLKKQYLTKQWLDTNIQRKKLRECTTNHTFDKGVLGSALKCDNTASSLPVFVYI